MRDSGLVCSSRLHTRCPGTRRSSHQRPTYSCRSNSSNTSSSSIETRRRPEMTRIWGICCRKASPCRSCSISGATCLWLESTWCDDVREPMWRACSLDRVTVRIARRTSLMAWADAREMPAWCHGYYPCGATRSSVYRSKSPPKSCWTSPATYAFFGSRPPATSWLRIVMLGKKSRFGAKSRARASTSCDFT